MHSSVSDFVGGKSRISPICNCRSSMTPERAPISTGKRSKTAGDGDFRIVCCRKNAENQLMSFSKKVDLGPITITLQNKNTGAQSTDFSSATMLLPCLLIGRSTKACPCLLIGRSTDACPLFMWVRGHMVQRRVTSFK